MELVIPTILLAINSNILYWKGQIINNHYEIIISPHGVLPKVREDIFQKKKKKRFSWRINVFFGKTYGEVILNGRPNDQIVSRWVRSFINNKNISQ